MEAHPIELHAVVATEVLNQRPSRAPDFEEEATALLALNRSLAAHPEEIFQQLSLTVQNLTRSDSAGVSLLNAAAGRFVWPAVVGGLANYVKAGTPSDFGPCGTVIEGRRPVLFQHPERHFAYLDSIQPPLEEVLLSPFFLKGEPVGTVWAVMHTPGKIFEPEDRRLLDSVASFAGLVYGVFLDNGTLEPYLEVAPADSRG
jgi:hypothetical protein